MFVNTSGGIVILKLKSLDLGFRHLKVLMGWNYLNMKKTFYCSFLLFQAEMFSAESWYQSFNARSEPALVVTVQLVLGFWGGFS